VLDPDDGIGTAQGLHVYGHGEDPADLIMDAVEHFQIEWGSR
jgi:hypothetical protein